MEEKKPAEEKPKQEQPKSSNKTCLIVAILGIVIVTIVIILAVWLGFRYVNKKIDTLDNSTTTKEESTTPPPESDTTVAPTETPAQAADNFLKSIFATFPGSSIDLAKADTYLSPDLKAKVNTTKESYWDLHGYIHSGPCSVAVSEISSSSTEAEVEVTTEWGETCMGMAEPYCHYKMSVSNGQWIITEIEELRDSSNMEQVPRDF